MRARDVPGFVLDPQSAWLTKTEPGAQHLAALERRAGESVSVHPGDLLVKLADEFAEHIVSHPGRGRAVVAVQQAPVAEERVGLVVRLGGKLHPVQVQGPHEHMVDVVMPGVAAAERVRI